MGEEVVFFRGENENVVALTDWCPHRGARFSNGFCEFKGTITCLYHGYTFDETGQCVAGLVESDDSPLAPKMKAQKYPTAEWNGIVFIWMGITEPVPLEDDLPWEFKDSTLTGRRFTRVKVWEANWTEPVNQGVDNHGLYLHRGLSFWRLVHRRLLFIRKAAIQAGQVKIVEEGDNYVNVRFGAVKYGQSTYKNVGKWPRHVWWRVLPRAKGDGGGAREGDVTQKQWAGHDHSLELPSKVRVPTGTHVHLRWGVPIDEMNTWMWTFKHLPKAAEHPGMAVSEHLLSPVAGPSDYYFSERARGPCGVQGGTAELRIAAEAGHRGHRGHILPASFGQAFTGLQAPGRRLWLLQTTSRPRPGCGEHPDT